ncbi:Fetuin-B [Microtus ochrogaster]|uniref:Fetuin-B n=1 Tax=Microtus ochrogaster TaxID=79684 RepID=A0A8J6KPR5_MICOH|nr:Fetuin-B [Microtus ochrogaster]
MALLRLLVFCTLAACCMARSVPPPPLPKPPRSYLLRPRNCNDSDVLAVAGFAMQNINTDQKDGYVLSLSRVHDAREHFQASDSLGQPRDRQQRSARGWPTGAFQFGSTVLCCCQQENMGSLFYLTLDVLETGCHVLSKKSWKDCSPRILHESVYGQCKAMFHMNKPRRVLYLLAYNCTLRPVSRSEINNMCPDCPGPIGLSNSDVMEAATESLAKFNSENPSKQYSVVKVTRVTSQVKLKCPAPHLIDLLCTIHGTASVSPRKFYEYQWVVGPSYFVDYLIKESPCTESQASCSLQPSDSEPVGLCHGSLVKAPEGKFVSVNCEFFESKARGSGGENPAVNQESKKLPQKNTDPASSPSVTAPRGSVQHLPDLNHEKPGDTKDIKGTKRPVEAFPVQLDLTTNPQGDTVDVSFLYLEPEEKKLEVLPFPGEQGRSAECPGPAEGTNPLILPP